MQQQSVEFSAKWDIHAVTIMVLNEKKNTFYTQ